MKRLVSTVALSLTCIGLIAATQASAQTPAEEQVRGKRLFLQCQACHDRTPSPSHKIGPNLYGVVGRRAGSLPGYKYSAALSGSHITWTDTTLAAWLKQPSGLIPGTSMVFAGVPDTADRTALVAYLKGRP